MDLTGMYGQNDDNEWCGAIVDNDTSEIVTVGVEFTEDAIVTWLEKSIASMAGGGAEAPDAYDRAH